MELVAKLNRKALMERVKSVDESVGNEIEEEKQLKEDEFTGFQRDLLIYTFQ